MEKLKELKFGKWIELLKTASQMVDFLEAQSPFNKTNKFNSVASITYTALFDFKYLIYYDWKLMA